LGVKDHQLATSKEWEHLLASCGRPVSSIQIRITDPINNVGEIEVKSHALMKGYWNNDEATKNVYQDNWLKTGDLGYLDKDGYLYIVDRKNDMIVSGGENIFPSEVEAVFYADNDIQEAVVFGVPDEKWVERVVAAVVLKEGAICTSVELIDRAKSKLAHYKCPKEIHICMSLPKSAAGKILRKELKNQYGLMTN
jgi:long-chain acyl-CoA synthetase